jgi:hypothetical protein
MFGSLALVTFLALAAPPAQSQCGPDGLDNGPCCASASVTLPQFPAMQTDAAWLCFRDCQLSQNVSYCAVLGVPQPATNAGQILCSVYDIRLRLRTCGTLNFIWNGSVKAYYSRTWQESSIAGSLNLQVWRFVVNGDMLPTNLVPPGACTKPACLNQYTRVYFSGYIDYAFDCINGGWQVSFAVSHECDSIHHQPGTARPAPAGGLHPRHSFSIVGPGSTFVPATAGPRSDGPINNGSVRWNRWLPAPQTCMFRERVQGAFLAQNEFCFCTSTGLNQYIATMVNASGACTSSIGPDPTFPFMQKRIGGWTSATQWPGQEFVLFDFGMLRYVNGCTGAATQEWFEGAETLQGYPKFDFNNMALGNQFEDLASASLSMVNQATRIGAPHVSYYILNFNLP